MFSNREIIFDETRQSLKKSLHNYFSLKQLSWLFMARIEGIHKCNIQFGECFKVASKPNGHYSYGLVDPLNNEIFYIGKGKGNRFEKHRLSDSGNMGKYLRILALKKQGIAYKTIVFKQFLTEKKAYEIEKLLILFFGKQLTNIQYLRKSESNIIPNSQLYQYSVECETWQEDLSVVVKKIYEAKKYGTKLIKGWYLYKGEVVVDNLREFSL